MPNSYYPHGSVSEQGLYQSLITESIFIKGEEFFYIPRKLVSPDPILTEDSLSKFKGAYAIDGYVDEIDHWGGAGQFMSKFGVFIEEQATITISRERWETLIGTYGETILPHRPCEGDLLWFPTSQTMLEIRFVENLAHFFGLHKQFVYKLKVELFAYSSERFETNIPEVDDHMLEKTFDLTNRNIETEDALNILDEAGGGAIIKELPTGNNKWDMSREFKDEANKILDFDETNPFGDIPR